MWSSLWEQMGSPLLYALPFIAIEALSLRDDGDDDRRGYSAIDSRTSLSMGAISLEFTLTFKLLTLALFVLLWSTLAPWHIATRTWWYWPLLMIVIDLAWYTARDPGERDPIL
jgi:hypothetical protein